MSETEPELGLGSIQQFTERTVTVAFPASAETRQYAIDNSPLRRVRLRRGDPIRRRDGTAVLITDVIEREGVLIYETEAGDVPESELSDQIGFGEPHQRLLNGQVEESEVFDLRSNALEFQHRRRKSKVRGFIGGRIDLIGHQLYVAAEVAERLLPRVLLADEVGLGKTIEAGLIVHRLVQTGRAQRVLVLVPEPLVHQWFVELLRRFNLWFHIFDAERCEAIETLNPETNPFLENQWVLGAIEFLSGSERRREQLVAAGWDMIVVDEAHHLGWSPGVVSAEYALVAELGKRSPGLLLLTATPEQLGTASHFARLRLLDPDRYYDLAEFLRELEQYRAVAGIVNKLLREEKLTLSESKHLAEILGQDQAQIRTRLEQIERGDPEARQRLMNELVDQHGTGRVMFRNTRAVMAGFPQRRLHTYALAARPESESLFEDLASEFEADTDPTGRSTFQPRFLDDPRIGWLVELVRELSAEKILLICRTRRKVEAIAEALAQRIQIKVAVFHDGLPLVQRDRNAAWFAEEDGARILLASEIGSEGRNFQFAHQLVLFDLPLDPELLEQRIGRLDRIGQSSDIHVHVPYVINSSQEVLVRWFGEGLEAFTTHLRGGRALLEKFGARVRDLAQDFHETQDTARDTLAVLIDQTRHAAKELATELEQGRDRLLELNSFRQQIAAGMIQTIRAEDEDRALDAFMLSVLDHFGIQVEELADRTYFVGSAGVFADTFPGLPKDGFTVTAIRQRALAREDIQFLSWDHPLVTGALDLIVGSEKGSSSLAHWPDAQASGLYLEVIFLIECVAPARLHADRFLPPTPLRVVVDHRGNDATRVIPREGFSQLLKPQPPYPLLSDLQLGEDLIPALMDKAETLASRSMVPIVAQARSEMIAHLTHEVERLTELRKVNRNVRPEEIQLLIEQQSALDQSLTAARLRRDAVRLIRRGA